jgi:hypothetical protein
MHVWKPHIKNFTRDLLKIYFEVSEAYSANASCGEDHISRRLWRCNAYRRFRAASSRTIRETFARYRRLRWSLGRAEREREGGEARGDYTERERERDQRPYGLSVARSGKGEKEKTRTRPRKHPTSDRQAPMVSKHRASVRTPALVQDASETDFPQLATFSRIK